MQIVLISIRGQHNDTISPKLLPRNREYLGYTNQVTIIDVYFVIDMI
jgi:hypothetical protein